MQCSRHHRKGRTISSARKGVFSGPAANPANMPAPKKPEIRPRMRWGDAVFSHAPSSIGNRLAQKPIAKRAMNQTGKLSVMASAARPIEQPNKAAAITRFSPTLAVS